MIYSNLKAIYRNGKFNLVEPLRLPEGTTVRLSIQPDEAGNLPSLMTFAGAWQDMPATEFDEFLKEVRQRRQTAFARRRERETGNG